MERNVKTAHENHHLLTTVHRLENEIKNYQAEINVLQMEIQNLREKMKQFHNMQLSAERKSTELLSLNNKLQGQYDDLKQQYEIISLDLEKTRGVSNEQLMKLNQLQSNLALKDKSVEEFELLANKNVTLQQTLQQKESQYYKELELIKQQKEMILQESTNLKQMIPIKEKTIQELTTQLSDMRRQYEDILSVKDKLQQEIVVLEKRKNHEKLNELKSDLQLTLTEFQALEQEKMTKNNLIHQLNVQMEKEKEKNVLLSMQLNLQEEKLKILTQELNVFRGIDVYHTSMQQELENYRTTKLIGDGGEEEKKGFDSRTGYRRQNLSFYGRNPAEFQKSNVNRDLSSKLRTSVSPKKKPIVIVPPKPETTTSAYPLPTTDDEASDRRLSMDEISSVNLEDNISPAQNNADAPNRMNQEASEIELLDSKTDELLKKNEKELQKIKIKIAELNSNRIPSQDDDDDEDDENDEDENEVFIQTDMKKKDQKYSPDKSMGYQSPKARIPIYNNNLSLSQSLDGPRLNLSDSKSISQFREDLNRYHQLVAKQKEAILQQKKVSNSPRIQYPYVNPERSSSPDLIRQRKFRPSPIKTSLLSTPSSDYDRIGSPSSSQVMKAKRKEQREKLLMEKIIQEEKQKQAAKEKQKPLPSSHFLDDSEDDRSTSHHENNNNNKKNNKGNNFFSSTNQASSQQRPNYDSNLSSSRFFDDDRDSKKTEEINTYRSRYDVLLHRESYQPDPNYKAEIYSSANLPNSRLHNSNIAATTTLMNHKLDLERAKRLLNK